MPDQGLAIEPIQTVERQHGDVRLVCPWRDEVRTKRCDQHDGHAVDPTDEKIEQLLRGRINPVQVLKDYQHGLLPRQGSELLLQCFESLLPPASRVVLNVAVASGGQQQEVSQQRHVPLGRGGLSHQRFQLVELCRGRVFPPEPGGSLEQIDYREERAVLVVRRTEEMQFGVPLRIKQIPECHGQA